MLAADSLYDLHSYEEAATAYEKVYFFSQNTNEKVNALFRRADCFKSLKRNFEAYKGLIRVLQFELNDSAKCAAQYELALNLFLAKYYNDAEKFCGRNRSLPVNTNEYKKSLLLHGLALNELNDYNAASLKFAEYNACGIYSPAEKDSLDKLVSIQYRKKNLPKLKSLRKARRLSKCIPGAGLFYAGKPGKAILNISLQLMAVAYTGANAYFGNYVTAATAGLFMVRSFYTGGVNQLNEIVPKVNYKRSRKFNDEFRKLYLTKIKNYHAD
jgi:TM2 domain-containing membrane protein YozV